MQALLCGIVIWICTSIAYAQEPCTGNLVSTMLTNEEIDLREKIKQGHCELIPNYLMIVDQSRAHMASLASPTCRVTSKPKAPPGMFYDGGTSMATSFLNSFSKFCGPKAKEASAGDSLMRRARAADQYCNDTDQDNAGHLYYQAKRAYLADGDQAAAGQADFAYNNHNKHCEQKTVIQRPSAVKKCQGIRAAIGSMRSAGKDSSFQEKMAARFGCPYN